MKMIKRMAVLTGTVAVAGTLLSPSAFAATSAATAPGATSASTATGVTPWGGSVGRGGDYGIGNCGYNNGGDTKWSGPESPTPGLGGFRKGDLSRCQWTPPAPPQSVVEPVEEAAEQPVEDSSSDTKNVELVIDENSWT